MGETDGSTTYLIASRLGRSGDDPIFALDAEARARKARGEDIINGTLGALLDDEGRLAVLPTAARAVHEVPAAEWAAYAPIAGQPAFLEAVIEDLFGAEPAFAAQAVAIATPGGSGALRHAIASFLDPGQALLTSSFYWGPYATLAHENDRGIETFSMFATAEALDLGALESGLERLLATQGRALLILNDPCHNPSGYSMSAEDWGGVVEIVGRHAATGPITVVLDNAYATYGPPDGMATALAALTEMSTCALVIVAWSASKSFTHYGLRVGALVALVPDEGERAAIRTALAFASRGTWSNCNRGGLVAITRLLTDPVLRPAVDAERAALVALLGDRVQVFNSAARAAGLTHPRYAGGFFVTVFTDDAQVAAARMRAEGVYVVPLPGALRLGICALPATEIPRAVDALARALRS